MTDLLPLFLNVAGRRVVLVGGGRVAAAKLQQLRAAGARVVVVAPEIHRDITVAEARALDRGESIAIRQRPFAAADLDDAWLVVAAATPGVNRAVADAADARHIFVNAVDDPANATAFLSGVVRRDGVTIAISTSGDAPALTALLREGLDALLPRDLAAWLWRARAARIGWKRDAVPMDARKPQLLRALNALYANGAADDAAIASGHGLVGGAEAGVLPAAARVPWLHAPEDSWL
jgi:uroporphyrin-III C-methyltransferase / precorrin-2 dehydrogenase / sirohydrochlorin ferrochelatase